MNREDINNILCYMVSFRAITLGDANVIMGLKAMNVPLEDIYQHINVQYTTMFNYVARKMLEMSGVPENEIEDSINDIVCKTDLMIAEAEYHLKNGKLK